MWRFNAHLHDVIEDTEIGFEELETQFGQVVAEGVLALTKDPNLSKSGCNGRLSRQNSEVSRGGLDREAIRPNHEPAEAPLRAGQRRNEPTTWKKPKRF